MGTGPTSQGEPHRELQRVLAVAPGLREARRNGGVGRLAPERALVEEAEADLVVRAKASRRAGAA